jgi:isocitrate lyase
MTPDARIQAEADQLEARWRDDPRWSGIERTYGAADVVRLRGSVVPEHTLARNGAERLFELLQRDEPVRALGAMTGGQAVQMVKAGLEAIYLSGWQVAADANAAGSTTRCSGPTRSTGRRDATGRTGTRRSSPTRKPGSAARSTRTS